MLLTPIINMLSEKSGYSLRYSSDCERLALDIEAKTGERLGNTTMKRMLGFTAEDTCPRLSSLDIIAKYLDFTNYDRLLQHINNIGGSEFTPTDNLESEDVAMGEWVKIEYQPNRRVVFTSMGGCKFLVSDALNSKLHIGDVVEIRQFVKGFPLICSSVVRAGVSVGQFVAGKIGGHSLVEHIKEAK